MNDYEISDIGCPYCDHDYTHVKRCDVIGCDDGQIDEYEEDPINCDPGDYYTCRECRGTGIVRWCPKCGNDVWPTQAMLAEAFNDFV